MEVIFEKTSHERNGVRCVRDDGTDTYAPSLESKSYLRHDLMHYCVEKHAKLAHSFYGMVASGKDFLQLREMEEVTGEGEAQMTERIVAMLQSSHHEEAFHADQTFARIVDSFALQDSVPPQYFTESFVSSAVSEFRFLLKRWNGLQTGESLTLEFPYLDS
jgi:type III secretion system FlhB-like substrate exporter